jgi:hypothetical protein
MLGPAVRVCEQVGSKSKSRHVRLTVSRYGQIRESVSNDDGILGSGRKRWEIDDYDVIGDSQ